MPMCAFSRVHFQGKLAAASLSCAARGLGDGEEEEMDPGQTDEVLMAKEMHHGWPVLVLVPGDRKSK